MKRKGFWGQVRKNRTLLCMLLPALLYVVIFSYIPMFGITIAFKVTITTEGSWEVPGAASRILNI